MRTDSTDSGDIELRQIDPERNRFRLYGMTECRTLFGEWCLRIVWGRIGHRPLRERCEFFATVDALERRRAELLARRRRNGYLRTEDLAASANAPTPAPDPSKAVEREIVEAHGLAVTDRRLRQLVARWVRVTRLLGTRVQAGEGEALGLEDVGTLAAMYAAAAGVR